MWRLVAEEPEAAALSVFIATKRHNGHFLAFAVFYLLLAFSSFYLQLCFAFGVSLATLPLFRFSLPGIHFLDLLFAKRLGLFHRL